MAQEDLSKLTIDKGSFTAKSSRRRGPRFWGGIALGAVVVAVILWKGVLARPVEVETATVSMVYPSQTFSLLNASGYVVAQRKAAVSSKATGRLEWLGVEEGSVVKAGQLLARLENRDVEASRLQAAANLKTARDSLTQAEVEERDASRNLKRYKQLLSEGIVSQADYDTAEARYKRDVAGTAGAAAAVKAAEAGLNGAAVAVEYTLIRSPFDGVVLTKNADIGDIVSPLAAAANAKAAVVTMADMSSLEVEADVSESNLSKVRAGQPCEVLLDALPESRFRGEVHTIVPTADRSKGSVMVKVRFLDHDRRILPEMSAKVAFLEHPLQPGEQKPKTALPPTSIAKKGDRSVVYVVRGDRVVETPVTLGGKIGDLVEVVSGVKPGERIAIKPLDKLHDGGRIKTAEK
ncbi:efflux RND transporter periplasmic adaptor subunit [Geomesophilobacter sediminis]|uniref:Efflux RND transporter periplasmic adaptor subunit n=1 Tax=Geomesophilobacter sediminis TaxID=2798584 RepID=A0A8J7M1D3_9BACT|nr:efflux RND transporter periplasmic adaptor subunit [Geomesophilobacter sediminis]MBJ6726878.1 efflux RND transporter periplasmic adaptor subunit [Geomesophilobacter sediminis]